ncbi:glycosyltransferase [Vibrio breoganii]
MKKNKLFVFLPSFGGGGAEKVVTNLVNNWKEKYQITIFVLRNEGPNKENIDDEISVIELKQKKIYFAIFELAFHLMKEKPEVVFTTLIYPISFISLLIPFFKHKTKFICRLSNIPSYEIEEIKSRLVKRLYLTAIQRYQAVICQSDDMLADLCSKTSKQNHFYKINNPVFFDKKVKSNNIANRFVLIGRLSKQKNIGLAIRAAHNANVYLDIFGTGPEEVKLQNLIDNLGAHKVKLRGFTHEVNQIILNSKALILSSDYEGFPNILIESISLGVPVIARNCPGGINEIVNLDNGMIFEQESELVEILKEFEPELYNKDKMIIDIKNKFSLDQISKSYLDLFEAI